MYDNTDTVINPSTIPIIVCTKIIAGNATFAGTVPETANSVAQNAAAKTIDNHAATNVPIKIPVLPGTSLLIPRYT